MVELSQKLEHFKEDKLNFSDIQFSDNKYLTNIILRRKNYAKSVPV